VQSWLYTLATAPGFRVAGRHVVITGGSSGLGLAIAKQYARAGAMVTILARNDAKLAAAKREIEVRSPPLWHGSGLGIPSYMCEINSLT
jgi:NAD(P)-dependent dehydrogenase (short-subunit alcohol dehydrogenase family)